jgi:cadmium resistance protein CadD (predicted permease)
VDDAFLLTFFFAQRISTRRIVAGQYLGFGAIIVVSLSGVWATLAIPHQWIRTLGLVPLTMGVLQLLQSRRPGQEVRRRSVNVASIALVTLSNGADNVGVYVPFFAKTRGYLWLILTVYALLVPIWCFTGRWLGNHSLVLYSVDRWSRWTVPLVFIGLGIYVLSS